MISYRDFNQYYSGTFLREKESKVLLEVNSVMPSEDGDNSPFRIGFYIYGPSGERIETASFHYDDDGAFWSKFEVITVPVGYIQHSSNVAVLLKMGPMRQYLKSLSSYRITISIPNEEAVRLCGIKINREDKELIMKLFTPYQTYTQAYLDVLRGDKLGACLSRRLAVCSNTDDTIPDLFYKTEKIGICKDNQILLFPQMREYKEYVQEITKVEDIQCA